jgi:hypothetical protein
VKRTRGNSLSVCVSVCLSVAVSVYMPWHGVHPVIECLSIFLCLHVDMAGKHVKFWSLRSEVEAEKDSFDDVSSFKGRKLKGRRPNPNPVWQHFLEGSLGAVPSSGGTVSDAGTW